MAVPRHDVKGKMHMRMRIAQIAALAALIVVADYRCVGRGGPKPPVSGSEYRKAGSADLPAR